MTVLEIRFVYPVCLSADEDGRIMVEFPDFSFGATDGADQDEALFNAIDCLEEMIAYCISDGLPIPAPSAMPDGWAAEVAPGPVIAAKAALYQTVRETGITKVALAKRLGIGENEVRRMLDPRHSTKIPALDRALASLGKRLEITIRNVAGNKQVA